MRNLLIVSVGILAAWLMGETVTIWLYPHIGSGGYLLVLCAGYVIAFGVGVILIRLTLHLRKRINDSESSGGLKLLMRPVTGFVAHATLVGGVFFTASGLMTPIVVWLEMIQNPTLREYANMLFLIAYASFFCVCAAWERGHFWLYHMLGKGTAPLRRAIRTLRFGKGGSAIFGGLLSEWETLFRPGMILLGKSLYNSEWNIGLHGDQHLLTIASTGGGKGRSAIIPNLLVWPGSALVIDPKGTNAAVTAARRGRGGGRVSEGLGQEVHVFDPFGVVAPLGIKTAAFNPLAQIDPDSDGIAEDIWAIADSLVIASTGAEHWDESAHNLIAGLIAHVVTTEPMEQRNLARVRDLLTSANFTTTSEDDDAFRMSVIGQMMSNPGAAQLAARAAAQMIAAGSRERGSIISTAIRHTKWLDSLPMRAVLSGDGFDLRDLKRKEMTIYVVIPPEELENHKRFLRLFVTLGIIAMTRETTRPKYRVLFLIDEFPALGHLESVRVGMNIIRSFGVILWPVIQNIGQLFHLYGKDAQTFLDATGAVQVFSVGGRETAEFTASYLGDRLIDRKSRGQVMTAMARLRTAGEVQEQTDRDGRRQLILRAGKTPLILKRIIYDEDFSREMFSPDPDHPEIDYFKYFIERAKALIAIMQ